MKLKQCVFKYMLYDIATSIEINHIQTFTRTIHAEIKSTKL